MPTEKDQQLGSKIFHAFYSACKALGVQIPPSKLEAAKTSFTQMAADIRASAAEITKQDIEEIVNARCEIQLEAVKQVMKEYVEGEQK